MADGNSFGHVLGAGLGANATAMFDEVAGGPNDARDRDNQQDGRTTELKSGRFELLRFRTFGAYLGQVDLVEGPLAKTCDESGLLVGVRGLLQDLLRNGAVVVGA